MSESTNSFNESVREDLGLIKAFAAGDSCSFDALVIKYKDRVFNLCYRFLGNYEDADDCAQEAFVNVYRSLKKFRFDSAFSTWLYRITVNTCKNMLASADYRRRKNTMRIRPRDDEAAAQDCISDVKDESALPSRLVAADEAERIIQERIAELPAEQRAVVVLCCIEGLSYEEASRITGFNIGTVKSKLARARCWLREKLKELI